MDNFKFETLQYEPLPSKSCIRLLLPASNRPNPNQATLCNQRLLHFKLEVADLNDPPPFDTLSYANVDPIWQVPSERRVEYSNTNKWPIAVNDRLVFVNKNLYEALCMLHPFEEASARVDRRLQPFNKTPLISEAERGNNYEVDRLIRSGADLRAVDQFGETALHYAAENGHLRCVKLLLQAGAELNVIDWLGRTPIDCGVQSRKGQFEDVARLLGDPNLLVDNMEPPTPHPFTAGHQRLWIDAICINDDDIEERNCQVAMMSEIYHKSQRVVSWLGVDDDESRIERADALIESPTSRTFTDAIEKLMNRSYFHRVWTVQELAVARSIVMFCGVQEILGLNRAILPYIALRSEIKRVGMAPKFHGGGLRIWLDRHLPDYKSELKLLAPTLQVDLSVKPPDRISWTSLIAMTWNHESTDTRDKIWSLYGLAEPLRSDSSFEVDYSRSKADLFLHVGRTFVEGDQSITQRETPIDNHHFQQHSTDPVRVLRAGDIAGHPLAPLDGLSYNQKSWDYHDGINIPSWCPDFGKHLKAYPIDTSRFLATGKMRCHFYPSAKEVLKLDAMIFDEIIETEELQRREPTEEVKLWARFACKTNPTYPTGESRLAALIRTILTDSGRSVYDQSLPTRDFPRSDRERKLVSGVLHLLDSSPDRGKDIIDLMPKLASIRLDLDRQLRETNSSPASAPSEMMAAKGGDEDDEGSDEDNFDAIVSRLTDHRCLIRTRRGYLGLSLMDTLVGDKVCLLAGAHVAHVLRYVGEKVGGIGGTQAMPPALPPSPGSDPVATAQYTFVGDAYVHGIMFGEALKDETRKFQVIEIQ